MPKENTHIHFANSLLKTLSSDSQAATIIRDNLPEFFLGSIGPDMLFYSNDERVSRISESLHGAGGCPTNEIILEILHANPSGRDMAFITGYLTHCVLDMVFHPVIYYLSGNYYDEDADKNRTARYMHRYLETRLDLFINSPLKVTGVIKREVLNGLLFMDILSEKYGFSPEQIHSSLKRQIFFNSLFSRISVYLAARLSIKNRTNLALFHRDIKRRHRLKRLDGRINYRDPVTGEKLETSYSGLFETAHEKAINGINALWDYHSSRIGPNELRAIIPGENLDTGLLSATAKEIRYTSPVTFQGRISY